MERESEWGSVWSQVPIPKDGINAALLSIWRVSTVSWPALKRINPLFGLSMYEVGLLVKKYPQMDTPPFKRHSLILLFLPVDWT